MKIKKGLSLGAGFVVISAPSAWGDALQYLELDSVEFSAESVSWSENLSIEGVLDGFKSDRFDAGGDASFTHNEARLELSGDHLGLFATTRYDYYAEYDPDVARLLVNDANGLPIQAGAYDVDLSLNEVQATGIGMSISHDLTDTISVEASVTALSLDRLTDGDVTGQLSAPQDGQFEAALSADYYYTRDIILERDVERPDGYGVTTDLKVNWAPTDNINVSVEARDLYSELHWKDAPRTELVSNTNRVTVADDGLLNVRPTLSGRESYEDHKQRYNPRLAASVAYDVNERWAVEQSVMKMDAVTLAESRVTWSVDDDLQISGTAEWSSGAIGAGVRWKNVDFELATNSLDADHASYLKATISVGVSF